MAIFKKYNTSLSRFVLFLTFIGLISCNTSKLYNDRIEGKKISVSSQYPDSDSIENFIAPYRNHIDKEMATVLAYAPVTMDKSQGKWQTTIGNLLANATFEKADSLFYMREKKHLDISLLNHGGIRSIIAKGNVTIGTAYEIMPFENSLIIAQMKGSAIQEMAEYIIREKRAHPIDGMEIIIDSKDNIKQIKVQDKPLELDATYYVATSDYLFNGGDSMFFFQKSIAHYDMDYKLRNLFIDYFKKVDTLPVITTQRIIVQ